MLKFFKSVQAKILYTRTSYYNLYQLCILRYHHSNRHLGYIPAVASGILTKFFNIRRSKPWQDGCAYTDRENDCDTVIDSVP